MADEFDRVLEVQGDVEESIERRTLRVLQGAIKDRIDEVERVQLIAQTLVAALAGLEGKPAPTPDGIDPAVLTIIDPAKIEAAEKAFRDYARAQQLLAARTDGHREAIQKLQDAEDTLQGLLKARTVLGADLMEASTELARLQMDPKATQEAIDLAKQLVAIERDRLVIQDALVNRAFEERKQAGINAEIRHLTVEQLEEIEALERRIALLQGRMFRSTDKWQSSMSRVVTSLGEIGRLFGGLGSDITDIVSGALQLVTHLEKLSEIRVRADSEKGASTAERFAATVGALGGGFAIASSLVSIGGDLISALGTNEEEIAELNKELKDMQHAFSVAVADFLKATTPAGQATGSQRAEILSLFEDLFGLGAGRGRSPVFAEEIGPILEALVRLGALPDAILEQLANSQFAAAGGGSGNFLKFWLEGLGVDDVRDAFLAVGAAGDSVAGVLRDMEIARDAFRLAGDDLFDFLTGRLADLDLNQALRDRLADITGLDITTAAGQEALRRLIADIGESLVEGTGEFIGEAGLNVDELNEILRTLLGFAEDDEGIEAISRSVQIARTITEIQANELLAIQESARLLLERILQELMRDSIGKGSTYNINVTVPPDLDNFGRVILEQIENEIVLKETA